MCREIIESGCRFGARLPPLFPLAAGILAGDAAAARIPFPYGTTSLAVFAGCALVLWTFSPLSRRMALFCSAALWGLWSADPMYRPHMTTGHIGSFVRRGPIWMEGRIIDDTGRRTARGNLVVAVEQTGVGSHVAPACGRIRLSVRRFSRTWAVGDQIRFRASVRRPRNFGTPGEFDYAAHLARRGIYATGYVDSDTAIELLESARHPAWLAGWRRRVGELIRANVPAPASGVLLALVIGREDDIDIELRRAFSRVGVSHVLSISGLHVGLVAGAGFWISRWLLSRSEWLLLTINVPKCAAAASVLPVLLYAGIAGSNLATQRAVLMILVFLGAVVVERRRHLMAGLSAAAVAIIAVSPGASLEISFQLSFLTVWALALATMKFWSWWPGFSERHLIPLRIDWWVRLWRPVLLYAAVSCSAVVASTPLTALYFNQVTPIAPLANALIVPPLGSLSVMLGLAAAFSEPLSPVIAGWVARGAGLSVQVGLTLIDWIDRIPWGSLRVVTPARFEVVSAYVTLAVFFLSRRRSVRRAAILLLVCATVEFVHTRLTTDRDELRITFLSIGQGDAAVLELPGGKVLVFDGGGVGDGTFDVGERVLAPFLWWRGIQRVYALSFSHPQFDHYGGLRFVAENFSPQEIWSTGSEADRAAFQRFKSAWQKAGALVVPLCRGAVWRDGELVIEVLAPGRLVAQRNPNNESLVLSVRYAGVRVLFTGDIEAEAEREILSQVRSEELEADVLKVAHHGSMTSSTAGFIRTVAPRLAIVSAGADNRFRFPDRRILRRFATERIPVLRTDLHGAVELRISRDGKLQTRWYRTAG